MRSLEPLTRGLGVTHVDYVFAPAEELRVTVDSTPLEESMRRVGGVTDPAAGRWD
jgi:hypothetical protein